jgi:hypothetical protein
VSGSEPQQGPYTGPLTEVTPTPRRQGQRAATLTGPQARGSDSCLLPRAAFPGVECGRLRTSLHTSKPFPAVASSACAELEVPGPLPVRPREAFAASFPSLAPSGAAPAWKLPAEEDACFGHSWANRPLVPTLLISAVSRGQGLGWPVPSLPSPCPQCIAHSPPLLPTATRQVPMQVGKPRPHTSPSPGEPSGHPCL